MPVPECLRARVRMTTCGRALPEKNVLGGSIDPGGVSRCLFQVRGWLGTPSPRCSPLRFDSGGAVSGGQAKCRNVADGVPTFERAPHFLDGTPIVRSTTSMAWGYWWASVPLAPRVRGHLKYGCPGPCFDSFGEALCFGTSAFGQRGSLQGASPAGRVDRRGSERLAAGWFGPHGTEAGFTSEHPFFEGRPERNAPEGNQVVSRFPGVCLRDRMGKDALSMHCLARVFQQCSWARWRPALRVGVGLYCVAEVPSDASH